MGDEYVAGVCGGEGSVEPAGIVAMPEEVVAAELHLVGFGKGVFTTSARRAIENNIMPHLLSTTRLEFRSVEMDFLVRGAASIAAHQFLIERAG